MLFGMESRETTLRMVYICGPLSFIYSSSRTGAPNDKLGGHHNRAFVIRDGDAPPSFMGVQLHHIQRQNGEKVSYL